MLLSPACSVVLSPCERPIHHLLIRVQFKLFVLTLDLEVFWWRLVRGEHTLTHFNKA